MKTWKDDPRSETTAVLAESPLKREVFGLNPGYQIKTLAPARYVAMGASVPSSMDWEKSTRWNRGSAAGSGTRPVGSSEQVGDEPKRFVESRFDGFFCNAIDPENLTRYVPRHLLALLRANGARKPRRRTHAFVGAVR